MTEEDSSRTSAKKRNATGLTTAVLGRHTSDEPLPHTLTLPDPPIIPAQTETTVDQLTEHLAWCPAFSFLAGAPVFDLSGSYFLHLPTGHVLLEAREAEAKQPRALGQDKALVFARWLDSATRHQDARNGAQIREKLHLLKLHEQNAIWRFHENPVDFDLHTHLAIGAAPRAAFERSIIQRPEDFPPNWRDMSPVLYKSGPIKPDWSRTEDPGRTPDQDQ
jgi:hypothetical protein